MGRVFRYISFMTPGMTVGALLFLLLLPLRRKRLKEQQLRSGTLRETTICLFWMYCGGMAVITLVPEPGWVLFALRGDGALTPYFDLSGLSHRISLVPFSQLDSLFNIVGNIVMFLPFGFSAALLWRNFHWKQALSLGVAITCGIECWQILTGRYFDIDDIILNTLGVFCGYLLWVLLKRSAPGFTGKFHVMDILKLVEPTMAYKEQVMACKAEMLEAHSSFDGCNGLRTAETYEEWLDFRGRDEKKGREPSSTWLTVRQSDGRVVGIVNCRSVLSEVLLQYGGHIGYCIRPSERRKGYAREQLRLALEKYREAGEDRVLVTCDKGNTGSEKTILANGGVLENEVEDKIGLGEAGIIRRYWITIKGETQ